MLMTFGTCVEMRIKLHRVSANYIPSTVGDHLRNFSKNEFGRKARPMIFG